jgi:hypothetical protein
MTLLDIAVFPVSNSKKIRALSKLETLPNTNALEYRRFESLIYIRMRNSKRVKKKVRT